VQPEMSFRNRVRRLEEPSWICPECAPPRGIVITYGYDVRDERCPACGRVLTIIRVVEEGDEEGEAIAGE
jgi:rubrerythrin